MLIQCVCVFPVVLIYIYIHIYITYAQIKLTQWHVLGLGYFLHSRTLIFVDTTAFTLQLV